MDQGRRLAISSTRAGLGSYVGSKVMTPSTRIGIETMKSADSFCRNAVWKLCSDLCDMSTSRYQSIGEKIML